MVTKKSCNLSEQRLDLLQKKDVEPVEPVLKNIYQSKSWPHFEDEPRFQEEQQVKNQQSCIFILVACLKITSSNKEHQRRRDKSVLYGRMVDL